MLCRQFVRNLACRKLRVLAKCGPEAATWTQTFMGLIAEALPKIINVVYHLDGVKPIWLNDCNLHKNGNI